MYENFLIKLDQKVNAYSKKNNRHSSRFIGEDMYPQFATGGSWKTQHVNGNIYTKCGDIWLNTTSYRILNNSRFGIFSINKVLYIESITVSSPTIIRIADTLLDVSPENEYNLIVFPMDDYEVFEDDIYVEFILRELL